MGSMISWGILGAGNIAGALVDGIRDTGDGDVVAIASRSRDRAAGFAERLAIPNAYGSYEELLENRDVDAVYVATTNDLHYRNTMDAIHAGKAVLCEKPFALNAGQAEEMVAAAESAGVFLMEAMWMRFIPAIEELISMVESGRLGELRAVLADFGFVAGAGAGHRLVEPELGGGALLDLGVYPITLAMLLLGVPDRVEATATIASTGVDEQVAATMGFADGALATAVASFTAASPLEAHIVGSNGRVHIRSPFHHPRQLDIHTDGGVETRHLPYEGNGYRYEVAEVHRALAAGDRESGKRPLADTVAVMRVLDTIRSRIGIVYPGE